MMAAVVTALLASCGSPGPTPKVSFPAEPLQTVAGANGLLRVAVRSSPQPPIQGITAFQFVVTDMSGAPIPGLTLSVQPWMPDMDHGAPVPPTVTPQDEGTYEIDNVDLFMAGRWQLRTTFSGSASDSAIPDFQVP
jgi:hypothetical protein